MSTSIPLGNASDLSSMLLLAEELDENKVTPGVLGFLVFAVMGLVVWWLMRSMTRHVDAVKGKSFEEPERSLPAPAAERSPSTSGGAEPKESESQS